MATDQDDDIGAFGAFKPVGHVVIAFDDDASAAGAAKAMRDAGIAAGDIEQTSAADQAARMEQLLDRAPGTAEFGHEIVLMRRYLELASAGSGFLTVRARDDDQVARVRDIAERAGARLAERYHRLAIEDLIDSPSGAASS